MKLLNARADTTLALTILTIAHVLHSSIGLFIACLAAFALTVLRWRMSDVPVIVHVLRCAFLLGVMTMAASTSALAFVVFAVTMEPQMFLFAATIFVVFCGLLARLANLCWRHHG